MKHPKSALFLALGLGLSLSGACASQRSSTTPCTGWSGTCRLKSVSKIAERESPVPYVVYEGMYEPVNGPGDVMMARANVEARALYESAIQAHFQANAEVPCQQTFDAECFPGNTVAQLPAFVPPAETTATGPTGCAILEDQSVGNEAAQTQKGAESLPEVIEFETGSTQMTAASQSAFEAAVSRLKSDASLQCIAITSQNAPGEAAGLAEQRTWAIRRLLVDRGIDGGRLQTVALQNAFAPGAEGGGMPVERKVRFKVLVRK